MELEKVLTVSAETYTLTSKFLKREVILSIFSPAKKVPPGEMGLLLINDGQDLDVMNFEAILSKLYAADEIDPLLFVRDKLRDGQEK